MEPGRLAVVLLVAGLVLVVGSCVPVVGSLYRFATLAPELTWAVPPATGRVHAEVRVPAGKRLAAGLRWRDGGASSHRIPDSVAFELNITRAGGEALQRLRGQWPENSGTMTAEPESGSDRYHRTARWLPPFTVAHDTLVFIDLAVDPMELAAGGTPGLELLLFREVPEFAVSFFSALVLWVLGILTVLIGAIWWLRHVAGNVLSPIAVPPDEDERLWAMFCHLSALLGYLLPFGQLVGPAVVWMAKRERSGFVDAHGREALNFQISIMLYAVIALLACLVLIGFLLLFALVIFHVAMTLYASLRAQQGDAVHYPMTLKILPERQFT